MDCHAEMHPKGRHPSSFRTEAIVWSVTLVIGLAVGAWNAVTASSSPSANPTHPLQLSSVTASAPAEADQATPLTGRENARGVAVVVGDWLIDKTVAFVRAAWWLLPIPIAFSLWRQFRTVPVCAHCASRNLAPSIGEE